MAIEHVLKFDFSNAYDRYICWLSSGYTYATYERSDNVTAVSPEMLTNCMMKSDAISDPPVENTPFAEWSFPTNVLRVLMEAHADMFVLPVAKGVLLTAWDDRTLPHGVESPSELQQTLQRMDSKIVMKEDSAFRKLQYYAFS